jgi:hypothetical protein
MTRVGVFATHLKTMTYGFQANPVAVQTVLDTFLHFLVGVAMGHLGHFPSPSG